MSIVFLASSPITWTPLPSGSFLTDESRSVPTGAQWRLARFIAVFFLSAPPLAVSAP